MTDYSLPVNGQDIKKAKTFYDIICWGGLLIVLLPVGIANVILGYFLGDSPCTTLLGAASADGLHRRCGALHGPATALNPSISR